jgi:hypothetical protein
MFRINDEYWDADRASYEDELEAWRERTAAPAPTGTDWLPWPTRPMPVWRPSSSVTWTRDDVARPPRVDGRRERGPRRSRRALVA